METSNEFYKKKKKKQTGPSKQKYKNSLDIKK